MNNKIILLTACVNPKGMVFTSLQDCNERVYQYISALNWYLKHTDIPIVVCENTLFDFSSSFKEYIAAGRLEFFTFDGNNYDRSLGKGYGETLIIKYALENSQIITFDSTIIKITGRTIVKNLNQLLKLCQNKNNIYADICMINGRLEANSRCFICPYSFITNYFLSEISKLNDSRCYYFENLLYDSAKEWEIDTIGKLIEPSCVIRYQGQSGSTGEVIDTTILKIIKKWVAKKLRRIGILKNYCFNK